MNSMILNRLPKSISAGGVLRRCFNHRLNSQHLEIQELCNKFAEKELKPNAAQLDRECKFPAEHIKKLASLGLMGAMVEPKYGGSGLDMLSLALAVEELSRGCASTGVILSIHNCLYANLVQQRGNDEQKSEFLGAFAKGSIGCFALSEPDAGSDVANTQTLAKEQGDQWVLNGQKAWVTSGIEGGAIIVFATVDKSLKHKGMACFILPLDSPGVTRGKNEGKLGIRATSTCSIYLDNVQVPKSGLIGQKGEGFKIAMEQLDQARVGIAAHAVGISQAALDLALQHASTRIAFGKPLAKLSSIQDRIADMAIQVESARLLTYRAATELTTKNSAMAKYVAGRCATAVSDHCVQILGGMGLSVEMSAERHYRDARGTQIYGGVTDVQKMIVAMQIIQQFGKI